MFALHQRVGVFETRWHSHPKHQLLFAEDGVLHLYTSSQQLILPVQHAAWLPAHSKHRLKSNSDKLYLRSIYFDVEALEPEILQRFNIFSLSRLAREMITFTERWPTVGDPDPTEQAFLKAIRQLVGEWCEQRLPLVLPLTDHPLLSEITRSIQAHLDQPLQLELLAQQYALSGRTLLRLFKHEMGTTFSMYLRTARIIQALELLSKPNANVTDVAYAVGYQSLSAFSKTFKQLTGVEPRTYLKNGRD